MKIKTEVFVIAVILAFFVVFNIAVASNIDKSSPKLMSDQAEKHYPPMILDHGGPDGGGYYFIDSDDNAMNAPVYDWVDISGNGTPVFLGDDETQGPFNIGFGFEFYGGHFTSVNICSNGFVSFTSTEDEYSNDNIPNEDEPNNLLAIWWDDLNPTDGGMIYYYYDQDHDRFIVSYDGIPNFWDGGNLNFQVILYPDGTIIYQYGIMDPGQDNLESATIGIENGDGAIGTEYLYNQQGIHEEMAVYFGFDAPVFAIYDVRPTAFIAPGGIGQVGDPFTPEVTFANIGQVTETFSVKLIIERDGNEIYNLTENINNLPPDSSQNVSFHEYSPDMEGVYILTAISELNRDENPTNDTLIQLFHAYAIVYYEDFESGTGSFTGDEDWEYGIPSTGPGMAYSGENLWGTLINDEYTMGPLLSSLISPPFNLSSDAVLGFWHWYYTENIYDGGNVKISTDNGATWTLITPDDGYDGVLSTDFENPIGGEEAFYGESEGWLFETFDLSAFSGSSVIFKFDYGSDWSVVRGDGWYIDDFTVIGAGSIDPGWVTGVVTGNISEDPIEGAVVSTGAVSDVTGNDGSYTLELFPGSYDITATAEYYNPLTIPGVVVDEGHTTTQDFALRAPMMEMDDDPINVDIPYGEILILDRDINNTGDGVLDYSISIAYDNTTLNAIEPSFTETPVIGQPDISVIKAKKAIPADNPTLCSPNHSNGEPPVILDFGDEVAYFGLQSQCGDNQLLGAIFALGHFWVSGGNSGNDPNNLYKFDIDGNLVDTYSQGTTDWGWLDLTWDGQYIYGTDFATDIIGQFDPSTGQVVGTVPNPTASGLGIAYDPATDHFWGVNWWGSNIIEFDRSGTIINSYPQAPLHSIFGIAWDNVSTDGPWLWCFSQEDGAELTVAQFDPVNGSMTGVQFIAINHDGVDIAGGLGFTTEFDPTLGLLVCLGQGDINDWVGLYEVTEAANWLQIDPTSGSINPGESETIEITFDMTEVDDTVQHLGTTINVSSNSPVSVSIDVNVDLISGIEGENGLLPSIFVLKQNYPNPFNARTVIDFAIPTASDVDLSVYNMLGQKVVTLVSGRLEAGCHRVNWNASGIASGLYFYKLTAGDKTEVREMTLVK